MIASPLGCRCYSGCCPQSQNAARPELEHRERTSVGGETLRYVVCRPQNLETVIVRVEFLLCAQLIHKATEAPDEYDYNGLPQGAHLRKASPVDSGGKSRTAVALIEVTAD